MKNIHSREIWRIKDVIDAVQAVDTSNSGFSANTIIATWIIIVLLGKEKARDYYGKEKAEHIIRMLQDFKISLHKTDLNKAEILGEDPDLLDFVTADVDSGKNGKKLEKIMMNYFKAKINKM